MLNDLKVVSERLAAWLCARGETGVEVLALQRTSGGFMSWHPRSCASTGLPAWTASPRWPGWVPPEAEMDLRDGSLSIGFGFGKYVNRNVVDAYGGVSRGVAQWTVRASRALDRAPAHRL